jgi:6-phosphogluconolactonase
VQNTDAGTLHAFDVGPTGKLNPIGPGGRLPATSAYITLDATGKNLLSASYAESLVLTRAIEPGVVGGASRQSVHKDVRQAHAILPSPDNTFLYYTSLAQDQVFWCSFDAASGAISAHASISEAPGSGPRHLRFSPQGEHVYVLNELSGTVAVFDRNRVTGSLQPKQTIGSVPSEFNLIPGRPRTPFTPDPPLESIWCAEVRLTPDGRFLYTTERSSSTVSIFVRDPNSGLLDYLETIATELQPRGMNIDPAGRHLVVGGERSNSITVYQIDPDRGSLTPTGRYPCAAGPMWIEFSTNGYDGGVS